MDSKQLAKIFKALSHPNRVELFLEIAKPREKDFDSGNCCCLLGDIIKCLKIGAPTISHHVKELANAGLIVTERKGKCLTARINKETVEQVRKTLEF